MPKHWWWGRRRWPGWAPPRGCCPRFHHLCTKHTKLVSLTRHCWEDSSHFLTNNESSGSLYNIFQTSRFVVIILSIRPRSWCHEIWYVGWQTTNLKYLGRSNGSSRRLNVIWCFYAIIKRAIQKCRLKAAKGEPGQRKHHRPCSR